MGRKAKAEMTEEQSIESKLITYGVDLNTIATKSLDEKKQLLADYDSATAMLTETKEVPETTNAVKIESMSVDVTSPNWTEYVLGLLTDDEKEGGHPKTDGLRRVAYELLGPYNSYTKVVQTPDINNAYRATVVVDVVFNSGLAMSGAADVFSGNTDKTYALHPVATAETRAEGRALRKALRIRTIVAEELSNADVDEPNGVDKRIVSGTLNGLKIMAKRVGVDLFKTAIKCGYNINDLSELTQQNGQDLATLIGKYARKEEAIPEEIKE